MVRVSEPWRPSWIARLVIDPDITNEAREWFDPSRIDPAAINGAEQRREYALQHNLRSAAERMQRERVTVATTDTAGDYFDRLARFGAADTLDI
jgi:hypothetical protein